MNPLDAFMEFLDGELSRRLGGPEDLAKIDEVLEKKMKDDGYGRKGLVFDPFSDQGVSGGLYRPKGAGSGFLSNQILKIVSRRDPIVSVILHTRAGQVASFCKRPQNRFDTGFRIVPKRGEKVDEEEVARIEEFILNCGKKEERSKDDILTFDQLGYMMSLDWQTYGHIAIEMIREMGGTLHCFLPLPGETIYRANNKINDKEQAKHAIDSQKSTRQRVTGENDFDVESVTDSGYTFLQVINGQVVEGFTDEGMIFAPLYLQSDIDLMGYAISPLERAISMITSHLQIENHQKMFFTHGVASRGILVIQGDVTPNQLRTLQAQWTNQVTGPNGAWRTPILAGIDGVQWQPLVMTNRDMEYAAYQDHVLRTIHAVFSIDPEETGYGYLSKGTEQRSMGESSNEWKITASRDKGLRPILGRIEAIINEHLLPAWNKDYAEKYDFAFVGIDAETRTEEIERLKEEVQLHSSIDEIRQEADKKPLKIGGGMILNPVWLQYVQLNMPKGMFMEKFMGIAGATERPDLQYIPDPLWFQWQQMQMQMMQGANGEGPNNPDGGGDPNDPNGEGQEGEEGDEQEGGNPFAGGDQKEAGPNGPQKDSKPPQKDSKPPQEGDNGPNKDSSDERQKDGAPQKEGDEPGSEDENDGKAQEELENQKALQRNGIQQFMDANPELFKSMNKNLSRKPKVFHDKHVDEMRDSLMKDFNRGASSLIKDIMKEVADDLLSSGDAEPHETPGAEVPVPPKKKRKKK